MTIWTPIAFAFGVIMFMAFTFLYCYWRVRHVRTTRLSSVQVSAIIPEAPQQHQQLPKQQLVGIEKDVLDAFPTIKANELKVGIQEENSQCPICLVEYAASEVLRQLPICGHIFHTSCVDSWLQKQPTCPVCRILLSPKLSSEAAVATTASPSPPTTPLGFWSIGQFLYLLRLLLHSRALLRARLQSASALRLLLLLPLILRWGTTSIIKAGSP